MSSILKKITLLFFAVIVISCLKGITQPSGKVNIKETNTEKTVIVDKLVDEEYIDSIQIYSQPLNKDRIELEATGKEHEPSKNKEPSDNNKEPSESNAKPESYSKIKKTNNKDKNSSPKVNKNSFKREKLFHDSKSEELKRSKAKMVRTGRLLKKVSSSDEVIVFFGVKVSVEDFSKCRLKYTVNGEPPPDTKTIQVTEVNSDNITYKSFKDLAFKSGSYLKKFVLDKTIVSTMKESIFCFKVDYNKVGPCSKIELILNKTGDRSSTEKLLVYIPKLTKGL